MLQGASLLIFSVRAVVLLLLVPLLWLTVAQRYNEALVALGKYLLPDGTALSTVGTHILIAYAPGSGSYSLDALTLHSGLVLMTVLVLAAVGVGPLQRISWLAGFFAGGFLLHVMGLALLARGVSWAASGGSTEESGALVFRLFAIFWGLLPALAGGAWAYLYWLPRLPGRTGPRSKSIAAGAQRP